MSQVWSLLGNSQRLDGGAMFGNAPRAVWQRWATPDDANRIALACRCLLVQADDGRRILLETGIGASFEPAMRERFGVVESGHVLLTALQALGLRDEDIDLVIVSHLHFDHAGGLLSAHEDGPPRLLFPRATYIVGNKAWQRALAPHPRDRASFLDPLQPLLAESGRLHLTDGADDAATAALLPPGWRVHLSDGHTPGLLLTEITTPRGPMLFCSDLCPGAAWVHLPITMGYDRYPELLIDEKAALWSELASRDGWLCFTHDPDVAAGRLHRDARGRWSVVDTVAALTP